MSLLFIKAHFYTHLPATSNLKMFPWESSIFGNNNMCWGIGSLLSRNISVSGLQLSFENVTHYIRLTIILAATRCPFPSLRDVGPFPL